MPQAKRSLGLIYAVNPFGADHQSSEHDPMYEEGASDLYLSRLARLGLTDPRPPYSLDAEKIRGAAAGPGPRLAAGGLTMPFSERGRCR